MINTWYNLHGFNATESFIDDRVRRFRGKVNCAGLISEKAIVGCGILNAVTLSGLAPSNVQARHLVKAGCVRIKDKKITDPKYQLVLEDFDDPHDHVIIIAKKKVGMLVPIDTEKDCYL